MNAERNCRIELSPNKRQHLSMQEIPTTINTLSPYIFFRRVLMCDQERMTVHSLTGEYILAQHVMKTIGVVFDYWFILAGR